MYVFVFVYAYVDELMFCLHALWRGRSCDFIVRAYVVCQGF